MTIGIEMKLKLATVYLDKKKRKLGIQIQGHDFALAWRKQIGANMNREVKVMTGLL